MLLADHIDNSVSELKLRLAASYAAAIAKMLTSSDTIVQLAEGLDELDFDSVLTSLTEAAKGLIDDWDGEVAE